ncbi:hypothetical protein TIFTF001_020966 [Ficus carica]|uniref:Uncharacterized protein n=1 Tax=Ficus carica TaxID=3494 RepID=A0AA88AUJ4_FICCA|nr:hypothetical protein TIFTF001_020966 [Ficus carica]
MSIPRTNVEPSASAVPSLTDEINPSIFKPQRINEPRDDPPKSDKAAEN